VDSDDDEDEGIDDEQPGVDGEQGAGCFCVDGLAH